MFKLKQTATFLWPVTVHIPNAGKFDKHTFDAEFKRLSMDELKALGEREADGEGVDACRQILLGWKGVVDDDGNDVPFSESALEQLLSIPAVRLAVLQAFREATNGGARRKN